MLGNKLNILGVSDEYFFKIEGEAIVEEVEEIVQEPTVPNAKPSGHSVLLVASTFAINWGLLIAIVK